MLKRLARYACVLFVMVLLGTGVVQGAGSPGQFYLTNSPQYWLYTVDDPAFSLQVPAKGDSYVQHDLFALRSLAISMGAGGPLFGVYVGTAGSDQAAADLRDAALGLWRSRLSGQKVTHNETITTSQKVDAHFYQVDGRGGDGKSGLVKWVGFRKGDKVVGLVLVSTESDYHGDLRAYWLQMVNTFVWK